MLKLFLKHILVHMLVDDGTKVFILQGISALQNNDTFPHFSLHALQLLLSPNYTVLSFSIRSLTVRDWEGCVLVYNDLQHINLKCMTHRHIHIHIYTHIVTHTRKYKHTHTHTHTHARARTHTHTGIHAHTFYIINKTGVTNGAVKSG